MKSLASIFLSILFLLTSSGISYSIHYCGNSVADIGFIQTKKCCGEEVEKSMQCCKDKSFHVKIQDNFVKSSVSLSENDKFITLYTATFSGQILHTVLPVLDSPSSQDIRPPSRNVPIPLLIQVFRI
jgi:hypothetical protein